MRRKVQLYIAGRQVDLGDDSWILYNWTREDAANPTAVVNSSSQQVELPGMCRNNGVLGSVFRLDRRTLFGTRYDGTHFDPTRKTPFMLYDADGTVLESGYARLDAVNTHSRRHAYTLTLYGGLGSFFYALSAKDDGTPRTLADMIWADMFGDDVTGFTVFPGADTVADAWKALGGTVPELKYWWNVVNFAPCYNGLPKDFDASHALMNASAWANIPEGVDEDGTRTYDWTYKAGLDCALVSFTNAHDEWELGDLRWYLQRPVVSVKAFIAAVCDPRNNGGYDVDLDSTFFNATNPYYADAWWTLPLIATEDRSSNACLANVLASTQSPMRYLVDYAKHFGLLFLWDSSRHKVGIVTRATFYDMGVTEGATGETSVVPSSYDSENSTYYALSDVSNAYADTTSTNYATITLVRGSGARTDFYFKFDFSNIPVDAVIQSVTVKTKTWINTGDTTRVASKGQNVCVGTTPKGSDEEITTTATVRTIDAGSGWTRAQLDDLAVHLFANRGNQSTSYGYVLRLYGAEVTVVWSLPSSVQRPVIDLSERIDRSQQITVDPVLADKRWYELGDGGKGEFVEQYAKDYGHGYAVQRIDTGYEFDAGTTVLTDGLAFKDAAEVQQNDLMYGVIFGDNPRATRYSFPLPRYEQVTIELWNTAGESKTFDVSCEKEINYWDVPEHPGADWLPKVQLHGADDAAQDGADVLVFFAGIASAPSFGTGINAGTKAYFLTDDDPAMTDLAGGPCWDLRRNLDGIVKTTLPSFRRNILSGAYITQSWEWGVPQVRPVLGIQYPSGAPTTLYAQWWKAYLTDRYDVDTRVMTAMVNLRGLAVGQGLLRRFWWYDNALWVLNAIRNHPLTSWDLTECEFVKVHDMEAYTTGPGSVRTKYLDVTPAADSFQVLSRGEILTFTVRSSAAWTLSFSAVQNWLVASAASGSAGTSVITLTATGNDSNARRAVTVTLTNSDGITRTFSVLQPPKTAGDISLNPSNITIQATGTGMRGQSSRVTTTDNAAWTVDDTTVESWLRYNVSSAGITVYADANNGASRSSFIKVYLTGDTDTYAILTVTQSEGSGGNGGITLTDGNGNTNATVQSAGGTVTLVLTIPDAASWTIASSANWATLSPSSGSDNATIIVTVPSYNGSADRSCTITATRDGYTEGAVFYLYQAAPAASQDYIQLTRASAPLYNNVEIDGNGGAGFPFDVLASGSWSVVSQSSWLHPLTQYGAWSGSGNATLWFSCDSNSGAARTGTIKGTHATTGEVSYFYVYQSGDGTVTLAASFNKSTVDASAQTIYLQIQVPSGLAWSIDNVSSGLTPETYSGSGPTEIAVSVAANSGSQRTLSLRVKNTMYGLSASPSVTQSAPSASNYLRVSPFGTVNKLATDTSVVFTIESNTSWSVSKSASDTDVTLSQSSGSGNGTVTVSFPASISNTARTIPITFSGASTINVSIVQAPGAGGMDVTVTPQVVHLSGAGSSSNVTLGSTGSWTASKSASWITVSPTSGSSGSGQTLTISAGRNTGAARTGTVTVISGSISRTITVNQASGADLSVSSNAVSLNADSGSTGSVTVYASDTWDLYEYNDIPLWLEVSYQTHAGSGNGEALTFTTKSDNTSGSTRTATVRIQLVDNPSVYQEITVSQLSQSSLYVSPTAANGTNTANTGFIHVTCNTSWEIYEIGTGITIAAAAQSGTGDADVMYAYTDNPDEEVRRIRVYFRTTDLEKEAMFTLIQAAATPAIQFDPDTALVFETSNEGTTLQLQRTVITTGAWTAASSKAWLTFSPSSGSAGSTVVTFTARGSLSDILTATWTVTCGDKTKTLGARCMPAPQPFDPNLNE